MGGKGEEEKEGMSVRRVGERGWGEQEGKKGGVGRKKEKNGRMKRRGWMAGRGERGRGRKG